MLLWEFSCRNLLMVEHHCRRTSGFILMCSVGEWFGVSLWKQESCGCSAEGRPEVACAVQWRVELMKVLLQK